MNMKLIVVFMLPVKSAVKVKAMLSILTVLKFPWMKKFIPLAQIHKCLCIIGAHGMSVTLNHDSAPTFNLSAAIPYVQGL